MDRQNIQEGKFLKISLLNAILNDKIIKFCFELQQLFIASLIYMKMSRCGGGGGGGELGSCCD